MTGLIGCNGEETFQLFTPLVSYETQKCAEWFDNLLKIIKSSLSMHTQNYLETIENFGIYFWIQKISMLNFYLKSVLFDKIIIVCLCWRSAWSKLKACQCRQFFYARLSSGQGMWPKLLSQEKFLNSVMSCNFMFCFSFKEYRWIISV